MRSTFPGSFEYFQKIPSTFKFPGLKNHCQNKTKQNMLDTYTFWSYFYCCCCCLYFVLFFCNIRRSMPSTMLDVDNRGTIPPKPGFLIVGAWGLSPNHPCTPWIFSKFPSIKTDVPYGVPPPKIEASPTIEKWSPFPWNGSKNKCKYQKLSLISVFHLQRMICLF